MKIIFLFIIVPFCFTANAQDIHKLSDADKIYGLSTFWQDVNYNFVYLNRIDKTAWDSLYRTMLDSVQATVNDYEYYHDLEKFAAFLKDGHTDITFPTYIDTTFLISNFGEYRFYVRNIGDKAVITEVNSSKKNEIPPGSEIIEVNGLPTEKYLDQYIKPYISSSTDYVVNNKAVNSMFRGFGGDKYDIKIKTPGNIIKAFNLVHKRTIETELFPPVTNADLLEFKWLANGIAYCALNSFEDDRIDTLFKNLLPRLTKAKGLIIDLRKNGGGSSVVGINILKYLINDTVLYGAKNFTRLSNATYNAYGKFVQPQDTITGKPEYGWTKEDCLNYFQTYNGNYYYSYPYSADTIAKRDTTIVVPTAILIGNATASAAEDFLIYADKQKHMTKIGERTFGSTGQPLLIDLPGGGTGRVCTKKDTYADGREFVGYGIQPDIEVKTTAEDFIRGNDPEIKKAIEYLALKIK